ncbi:MAG: winged helix-turn-helix transcriptional regulator [Elainellaceae cyanobacterium]
MTNSNSRPSILDSHPHLRRTLDLVSDKWVTSALYVLYSGTKRYSDVQSEIGGISQRMLTRTLRNLERDGLVKRTAYDEQPPRVDYALTPLGESLIPHLKGLCEWAIANFDQVEVARRQGDVSET